MMMGIDLHIHSNYSDGTLTPLEILKQSEKLHIPAISITDHDTVSGVMTIMDNPSPVEIISGVELSTKHLNGEDIHILGYYPDIKSERFHEVLENIQLDRIARNKQMVDKLHEHGVNINYEDFINEYPNLVVTRATFGAYLLKHGYVKSIREAFKKYIGIGCPCYLPRKPISPKEGVKYLTESKALTYIAHPGLYNFTDQEFEQIVKDLIPYGLTGIECYHSSHSLDQVLKYRELAKKYNLLTSGGSDFHGENKPDIKLGKGRGNLYVPYHLLEQMNKIKKL